MTFLCASMTFLCASMTFLCRCVLRCRAFAKKHGFSARRQRQQDFKRTLVSHDADVIRHNADLATLSMTEPTVLDRPTNKLNSDEKDQSKEDTDDAAGATHLHSVSTAVRTTATTRTRRQKKYSSLNEPNVGAVVVFRCTTTFHGETNVLILGYIYQPISVSYYENVFYVQMVRRRYRSYDENDLKLALSQKSLRLGEKLTGIPCSTLVNYKNKQSQNFVRIGQQPNLPDDALEELARKMRYMLPKPRCTVH